MQLIIYYWVPSFEIEADIFMSGESFDEPLGESNTQRLVKIISQCFKRQHLIMYLLSNHEI